MAVVNKHRFARSVERQIANAHFGPAWLKMLSAMGSPLYAHLAANIAQDMELLNLLTSARSGQPLALLLFNAVQFLLRASPFDVLAEYYPVLTPNPSPPENAFRDFRRFCLTNAKLLRDLLATKTMQFTSVDRAFGVMLALSEVEARIGEPFPLVEIGSSAGLLLGFDRFAFDFGADGFLGAPGAAVTSSLRFFGPKPQKPLQLPKISTRVGVDLAPIRPHDQEAIRWAVSAYPPEWVSSAAKLTSAIAACAEPPLEILAADALDVLADLAARSDGPLCILHAHVLYQWPALSVQALDATIEKIAETRPVYRISIEADANGPEDLAKMAASKAREGNRIDLVSYSRGERTVENLGCFIEGGANLGIRWRV